MIELKNVTLSYESYHDRSNSLKEVVLNRIHRRKYTDKPQSTSYFDALKDINLRVEQGERLAIIGRNGAGKSTLLKVMCGVLKPTRGEVTVVGNVQPLIEISAGFNPEFSGRENIYLNGYMLGFSHSQIVKKEKEIIEFADLAEFIDVPVKYYSSGMAVRLAFTIATSIEPEILIFDEMLSAGDVGFLSRAKSRLDDLVSRAKLAVLVSHDLMLVKNFATRCLFIDHGEIVFDGHPEEAVEVYYRSLRAHEAEVNVAVSEISNASARHIGRGLYQVDINCSFKAYRPMDLQSAEMFVEAYGKVSKVRIIGDFLEKGIEAGNYNIPIQIKDVPLSAMNATVQIGIECKVDGEVRRFPSQKTEIKIAEFDHIIIQDVVTARLDKFS